MTTTIDLPYGHRPYRWAAPEGAVVIWPPTPPPGSAVRPLLDAALDAPIGAPRLETLARPGARVTIAVSDVTRDEPRAALLEALMDRLGDVALTLAVANGTHGPCDLTRLGLPGALLARARVINHDAHDPTDLVTLSTTRRGTPLRVHRCLVECDIAIATGRIKPHYFAGYAAGAKAFFPGLGGNAEIRRNHLLKADPRSRAGSVDGNPCREDLEEIVDALPAPTYLLNVITDATGAAQAAVAGDVRAAFRKGAQLCESLYAARAAPADWVVVSDELPLTASLYQASKLVAAVAAHVRPGGRIALVAECPDGTGPLETVNRAIFELGIRPRLPADCTIHLISSLPPAEVAQTYCTPAASIDELDVGDAPLVVPRAGVMLLRS